MKEKVNITINSAMAYVMAFLVTTINHELSHALMGVINGSKPILHHNYVEHVSDANLPKWSLILIALAGPVFSLTQGLVAGLVFYGFNRQSLLKLFLLWLSVLGFSNIFGYLMTGPVFTNGDIGRVYQILNFPLFGSIFMAVFGAAALLFVVSKLAVPFLQFSYRTGWLADKKARKNFAFSIIILPWIIGSVVVTLLYLPIIAIGSIIYPIMSGVIFIFPWQSAQGELEVNISEEKYVGSFSVPLLFFLLLLIVVFRWVLAPGIQLFVN